MSIHQFPRSRETFTLADFDPVMSAIPDAAAPVPQPEHTKYRVDRYVAHETDALEAGGRRAYLAARPLPLHRDAGWLAIGGAFIAGAAAVVILGCIVFGFVPVKIIGVILGSRP